MPYFLQLIEHGPYPRVMNPQAKAAGYQRYQVFLMEVCLLPKILEESFPT